MTIMLSDQELAGLHSYFCAPLAVADMLNKQHAPEETDRAALNAIFADLLPDSALLAAALCAQHLAARMQGDTPLAATLNLNASQIVDDYGPYWLRHAKNIAPADQAGLTDILGYVPEDLEALSDLLAVCADAIEDTDGTEAQLCRLLGKQCAHHAFLAQAFLEELDLDEGPDVPACETGAAKQGGDTLPISTMTTGHNQSNVIPFPVIARQV